MWESRRDFQGVWEGWEAGFMAFHAFHTLSFPWPALRSGNDAPSLRSMHLTNMPPPSARCRIRPKMLIGISWLINECIGDLSQIQTHPIYEY